MNPTIVVSAYNRPVALRRLLSSLSKAVYPPGAGTRLIISIDRGDDNGYVQVVDLAREFKWPFGPKDIIEQEEHLGLVRHYFFCCGLSQIHDRIIHLEDDLIVSPVFHAYAAQALDHYSEDDRIAALSLYGLWFNGYTQQAFVPIADGSDVFFLQMPYTQGQVFTRSQWKNFSGWMASDDGRLSSGDPLHDSFFHFGPDEWFPLLAKFVVATGRHVVYPRISLASGAGDAGTHFDRSSVFFQTPLQGMKLNFNFSALDDALAVYDPFFEILPSRLNRLAGPLGEFDYEVDLYATKARRHLHSEYVLTSRRCRTARLTFGKTMWPIESNVIENVPGDEIFMTRVDDLKWDWRSELLTRKSNHDFFTRHRRMSRKLQLEFALIDLFAAVRDHLR